MADRILRLLDGLSRLVGDAFLESVRDAKRSVQLPVLARHIERGDTEAALEALNLRPEFMGPLSEAVAAAYAGGGRGAVAGFPEVTDPATGGTAAVRFDAGSPRSLAWVRDRTRRLVEWVVGDQREWAREFVARRDRDPQAAALALVGRSRGVRGGLVGLTSGQVESVLRAEEEMARGASAAAVSVAMRRNTEKLLERRAGLVGSTEALVALNAATHEGLRQVVDRGLLRANQIRRTWDSTGDAHTRGTHAEVSGQERGLEEPFSVGGYFMMHPGDTAMGAPAGEVIGCRCVVRVGVTE